ncbi:MAG: recombinase family protein, partial [Microgenomates group bacterium]
MDQKAIIYCRVSSDRQVKEGHGLEGQEKRCRDYATSKGYKVMKIFKEEGISGGLINRPEMEKLLLFLEKNTNINEKIVVIVDDIKRLARNVEGHFILKASIYSKNATLESPSHKFEDTAEGKFIETVLAGASELERNQNARQVKNRMKARMELGCWSLRSPALGLKYARDPNYGKILMNDEPYASIYKEAIEKYANHSLNTLEEVRRFIEKKYLEQGLKRKTSINGTKNILTELLYTGYLEYKPWNVSLRRGRHKGFISMETYNIVQEKLKGKAKPSLRKDYNLDFPLRSYVLCDDCDKPLTASWNKGRSIRYPYYKCKNKTCTLYDKSIKREIIEKEFENVLEKTKPSELSINLMKDVLNDVWTSNQADGKVVSERICKQIIEKEGIIKNYMDRIGKTSITELLKRYEDEITLL